MTKEELESALQRQPLFDQKTWRLSLEPWPLSKAQLRQLEDIGAACLAFYRAVETLYLKSAANDNLLRNKEFRAPWVAELYDRGKPAELIRHARSKANKSRVPPVLRPDLLLTEDGFSLTELDSVPGGIGLTAWFNDFYANERSENLLGAGAGMEEAFHSALTRLAKDQEDLLIAIVVSEEAATYRPEMDWLAARLRDRGHRVHVCRPDDLRREGRDLLLSAPDSSDERVDLLYRFWELFDLANISFASALLADELDVVVAPPMRPFQEEKLSLALFHHHLLEEYWRQALGKRHFKTLRQLIPPGWVMEPLDLPPGAVLSAPPVNGRPPHSWLDLAEAGRKERELIIKVSGFDETAWGARGVTLGSDVSTEEWREAIEAALDAAPHHPHIVQEFRKPRVAEHPVFTGNGDETEIAKGRLRLCPYFFVQGDAVKLAGALATFCPADKKIIHGMEDAVLLPCAVVD